MDSFLFFSVPLHISLHQYLEKIYEEKGHEKEREGGMKIWQIRYKVLDTMEDLWLYTAGFNRIAIKKVIMTFPSSYSWELFFKDCPVVYPISIYCLGEWFIQKMVSLIHIRHVWKRFLQTWKKYEKITTTT